MKIQPLLAKLGLNERDTNVFLALVKLGPSPVRSIAREANVNRGTTYDTLKHLLSQGLVAYYHREKHQYFVAEPPERLLELIDDRVKRDLETRQEVERALPHLASLYATPGEKPTVKYYEGFRGAKAILRDVLAVMSAETDREYFVYSSVDLRNHLYQEFPNFTEERIKRKIKVKTIAIGGGGGRHGLDERRWLSKKESAPAYVIIYGGKVAAIALDANRNPMGILIENRAVAETEKLVFRSLWETLEASA